MNRHISNCDQDDCAVCDSYLRELQETIQPLYVYIKAYTNHSENGEIYTLSEFSN